MLTTRVLPPAEWARLEGTALETLWPTFDPDPLKTRVVVVEDGEVIVGHWVFFQWLHAECVGIAPAYRKRGGVARLLLRGLRRTAADWGFKAFMTGSVTDDVRRLIVDHLKGMEIPSAFFSVPVSKE